MKILLDHDLPAEFRFCLSPHIADAAEWVGLRMKSDEELIRAAEDRGYDVLLLVDDGISSVSFLPGRQLVVVNIPKAKAHLSLLIPMKAAILNKAEMAAAGETVAVD
jgi:predicted nuclease of predicted toxin-antitoxin system